MENNNNLGKFRSSRVAAIGSPSAAASTGTSFVNEPGARQAKGGTVIQMAKRSSQLESIADGIEALTPKNGTEEVTLTAQQARQLWGWAQTIGIVANELKKSGK